MRVWNVQTGECTNTLRGHTNSVCSVTFDGKSIVSGSDKTVRIWYAPHNTDKCERVIEGHTSTVDRVWLCTVPNEHIVVSADGTVRDSVYVHDIRTGERVFAPIEYVDCKLS